MLVSDTVSSESMDVFLLFLTRLGSSWSLPSRRAYKDICAQLLSEAECASSLSQSVCRASLLRTFLIRLRYRGNYPSEFYRPQCCWLEIRVLQLQFQRTAEKEEEAPLASSTQ